MSPLAKPSVRPRVAQFSSGPCAKRPGWSADKLAAACLGRSHRSRDRRAKIAEGIERALAMLGLPAPHRLGVVAGSDTGAGEIAIWSLLGVRGVDVLAWESFGRGWAADARDQLKLADLRILEADYGRLPDLGRVDFDR